MVQFQLRDMDLGKQLKAVRPGYAPTCQLDQTTRLYDLCAVSNHIGTMETGHYTVRIIGAEFLEDINHCDIERLPLEIELSWFYIPLVLAICGFKI